MLTPLSTGVEIFEVCEGFDSNYERRSRRLRGVLSEGKVLHFHTTTFFPETPSPFLASYCFYNP